MGYEERQAQMCKANTGRAYGTPCVPTMKIPEFYQMNKGIIHLYNWRCFAGTDTPRRVQPPCSQMLLWQKFQEYFWIVGTMPRMDEIQILLVDGLGLNQKLKLGFSTNNNKKSLGTSTLSSSEFKNLQVDNACDIMVYEAAHQYLSQLVVEYGEEHRT
eukprot:2451685-Amphidinium_carterae.1